MLCLAAIALYQNMRHIVSPRRDEDVHQLSLPEKPSNGKVLAYTTFMATRIPLASRTTNFRTIIITAMFCK